MKVFSILLILLVNNLYAQSITESILEFKEGYSSSNLLVNYFRNFNVGEKDTTYSVLIKLTNKDTQIEGYSLGAVFFGSGSASGFNLNLKTNVSSDEIILTSAQFNQFLDCLTKVFMYLVDKRQFTNNGLNTVASCSVEGLAIGGELMPGKSSNKELVFYLKLGDKNYYKATFEEYTSTIQKFARIQADLKTRVFK